MHSIPTKQIISGDNPLRVVETEEDLEDGIDGLGMEDDSDDENEDEDERKSNGSEEEEPVLAGKSNTCHPLPPLATDSFNALAVECENWISTPYSKYRTFRPWSPSAYLLLLDNQIALTALYNPEFFVCDSQSLYRRSSVPYVWQYYRAQTDMHGYLDLDAALMPDQSSGSLDIVL